MQAFYQTPFQPHTQARVAQLLPGQLVVPEIQVQLPQGANYLEYIFLSERRFVAYLCKKNSTWKKFRG